MPRRQSIELRRVFRVFVLLVFAIQTLPTAGAAASVSGANSLTSYVNASNFLSLPFGTHSHWIQPWRAYMETVPAATFVDGLGMNFNLDGANPDLVMQMLASHGIRHVRIEIGWGEFNYGNETQLNDPPRWQAELLAAKKYGVRPLILLNANQGMPCPLQVLTPTLTMAAAAGSTTLQVDNTTGILAGYSGLSNLTQPWAAEDLVTGISGNTLTLSKPLPVAVPGGTKAPIETLKYRPFSVPGSADYQATMKGWTRYVGSVATFAANVLGTSGATDKGFDMEIWNELTFGSAFLDINAYYASHPYQYDQQAIWFDLVQKTASYMDSNTTLFSGVQVGDGFANTTPWQAASIEPSRITAIDKHPYANRHIFPQDEQQGIALNALGQVDPYVPSYTALFPEYYGTAIQTETMVRDMGSLTSLVQGIAHGRFARSVNGAISPVTSWITEVNLAPDWGNSAISPAAALALKGKTTARYAAFYLNKGVTQLDFFGVSGGDTDVGMVDDSFLALARQTGAMYPTNDTAFTSPALTVLQRMVNQLSTNLDRSLTTGRPLQVLSITDTHNHAQFSGDGTAAHPPLFDRDVFTFLPYQVNAHRFVIPYYVMTRDVTKPLTPELFTVQIQGLHGAGATVSAYDPLYNVSVPVAVLSAGQNDLTLGLTTTDYPYLLTIQEP